MSNVDIFFKARRQEQGKQEGEGEGRSNVDIITKT